MSTHIKEQSWNNYKESQSLTSYTWRNLLHRYFGCNNISRIRNISGNMKIRSNIQVPEAIQLLGTRLIINSHTLFPRLDPDIAETTIYLKDNNLTGKTLQYGIIKAGEKSVKKKMAAVQEGMAKKAFQQFTIPSEDPSEDYLPGINSVVYRLGVAAKPQLKIQPRSDIEKDFCIGITTLDGLENRDFTKSKWYVLFLPEFGVEASVEFVKRARELASKQDVDFFKMIVVSTSKNATRINEAFTGTGVIIRHYRDLTNLIDSLERLDKELAEYKI